ncbi:MAG: M55 family metallopeptidase [Clostridia bacterium]
MKYAIAVDLEGIAGIVGEPGQGLGREGRQTAFACEQAVREINAAVKALFESGASEVLVWDNHNGSLNLDYASLDKRVSIIAGTGAMHRWPGLDESVDGVLLMGYHAKADTYCGILSHTCSSETYQYIKINGRTIGEMEIDAACAAKLLKAPVIFVSSDEEGIRQAKESLPWAGTVSVKKPLGRNLAILKHPLAVVDEIYLGVKACAAAMDRMELFHFNEPLEVEIRFMRLEKAERMAKDRSGMYELKDPYTVAFKAKSILEMY